MSHLNKYGRAGGAPPTTTIGDEDRSKLSRKKSRGLTWGSGKGKYLWYKKINIHVFIYGMSYQHIDW